MDEKLRISIGRFLWLSFWPHDGSAQVHREGGSGMLSGTLSEMLSGTLSGMLGRSVRRSGERCERSGSFADS